MMEKRTPDSELAKSLLIMATNRFDYFFPKGNSIFTMEGIYEAILELSHTLMALQGLKTVSHECAIAFLKGRYLDDYEVDFLDKLRKKRHGAKYYGRILSEETIGNNIERGVAVFKKMKSVAEKELAKH